MNYTVNITDSDIVDWNKYMLNHHLFPSLVYICMLLVIGVPGNGLTCYVYGFKWKKTTSRVFILALASLDIVNCLTSMTTEIALLVKFLDFDFPTVCKVSRFLTYVFNFSSSLILTAIAFDRYRRICQPFKVPLNQQQAKNIVCSCIAVAIFTGSPALIIYGTQFVPIEIPGKGKFVFGRTCLIDKSISHTKYPLIFYLWLLMTLFVMDIVLIVIYSLIGRAMFQRKTRRESLRMGSSKKLRKSVSTDTTETGSENKAKKTTSISFKENQPKGDKNIHTGKTTIMLFLVTIVFVVSFVPFTILVIIRFVDLNFYDNLSNNDKSVYHVFLRSYFMNCAFNPIVYCFVSKQFRSKCKKAIMDDIICCKRGR